MTPQEAQERMQDLTVRLRWWESGVWMRHAENPASEEAAKACTFCQGSGRAHICLNSNCEGRKNPTDECLHPTVEETRRFRCLQDEFEMTANQVVLEMQKAVAQVGFLEQVFQRRRA